MARRTEFCFREAMIENLDDAAVAVDKSGDVKVFNPAAAALFGTRAEDAIDRKIWEVIKYRELDNLIMDAARSKTPTRTEKVVLIGQTPYLIKIFTAINKNGKPFGAAATLRNLEEFLKIEKALSNYVDNISHEFKAPLTAIKGYVETLLEDSYASDPEVSRKFLQIINDETNRMTRLIVNMMDRSGGKRPWTVSSSPIDPSIQLMQAVDLFRGMAARRNISIETEVSGGRQFITANEDALRQIFVNLLDNAVKFTGIKKSGRISVSCYPDGRSVRVVIADDGIGIPEAHLPRVFDKFYRVNEGAAAALGGTGLGLTITRKLCEEMGGSIDIQSKEGEGTRVRLTFPASRSF